VQPPRLPGNLAIARPRDNQELATQSAVFGLLAVWTLAQVRMCKLQKLAWIQLELTCCRMLLYSRQALHSFTTLFVISCCLHMQALTTPPSQLGMTDTGTPGLQLAVACAASLYFLRQNKRLGLGECGSPVVFASRDACFGSSRKLQLPGQQQQAVSQQWLHRSIKNV
jgi:hypothetical protein